MSTSTFPAECIVHDIDFLEKIGTINSTHTARHAKTVKHGYLPTDAQQDSKLEAV